MSIQGNTVKAVGEVPLEQEAAAVVITPDGKRAFVCLNLVNKVGVLAIDGTKVTYDKTLDIPSAFNPYNIDITPDGKFAVSSHTGAQGINADAEVSIDASGEHPHVVAIMAPGTGAEGFAISPNGKWAVTPLIEGSGAHAGRVEPHPGRPRGADVGRVRRQADGDRTRRRSARCRRASRSARTANTSISATTSTGICRSSASPAASWSRWGPWRCQGSRPLSGG